MEFMRCAPNRYFCQEVESRWRDLLEIILSCPDLRPFSNFPFYDNILWLGLCAAGSKLRPTNDSSLYNKFEDVKAKFKNSIENGLDETKKHFQWDSYTQENHLRLTRRIVEASEAFADDDCITIVDTLYPVHNEVSAVQTKLNCV
ncbi:hypothetical protein Ciccas_000681 [Cichlidogyrus casuarinus]|uniref:Uncharacterized protein n=1 Tax=Cichlidogyrus casuarinus TaxID=1844966 RepID=A0ABD2QMC2_9PLAT